MKPTGSLLPLLKRNPRNKPYAKIHAGRLAADHFSFSHALEIGPVAFQGD